jgi:hypothetical protein
LISEKYINRGDRPASRFFINTFQKPAERVFSPDGYRLHFKKLEMRRLNIKIILDIIKFMLFGQRILDGGMDRQFMRAIN